MNTEPTGYSQGSYGVVHRVIQRSAADISLIILVLGILVYGVLGSPTPDVFGSVEVFVGLCLLIAAGRGAILSFMRFKGLVFWRGAGVVLCIYGVSIPLVTGVVMGASAAAILRDIAPFLFMMLAVFMADRFEKDPQSFKPLVLALAGVGVLFSLRSLNVLGENQDLYYLANMPSVFFAAFVSAGLALQVLARRFSFACLPLAAVLAVISAVTIWPMVEVQQRASLGLFVLLLVALLALVFVRHPKRGVVITVVMAIAGAVFADNIFSVWATLSHKTELVGVNMRFEEMRAVWAAVNERSFGVVFGLGWGAKFSSPAVADIRIGYTHSLLSGMVLKTGLVGAVLTLAYLGGLAGLLVKTKGYMAIVLALGGALVIDTFLYASYKSLDFGVVLMLVPALYSYARFSNEETPRIVEPEGRLV